MADDFRAAFAVLDNFDEQDATVTEQQQQQQQQQQQPSAASAIAARLVVSVSAAVSYAMVAPEPLSGGASSFGMLVAHADDDDDDDDTNANGQYQRERPQAGYARFDDAEPSAAAAASPLSAAPWTAFDGTTPTNGVHAVVDTQSGPNTNAENEEDDEDEDDDDPRLLAAIAAAAAAAAADMARTAVRRVADTSADAAASQSSTAATESPLDESGELCEQDGMLEFGGFVSYGQGAFRPPAHDVPENLPMAGAPPPAPADAPPVRPRKSDSMSYTFLLEETDRQLRDLAAQRAGAPIDNVNSLRVEPLSPATISEIKSVMAGIKLAMPPPPK